MAVPWFMGVGFVVLAQQVLAAVVAIRRPDDRVGCARASATPRRRRELVRAGTNGRKVPLSGRFARSLELPLPTHPRRG